MNFKFFIVVSLGKVVDGDWGLEVFAI